MRLGISSYTFTWAVGMKGHQPERPVGPMDLLEKAVELGVKVVQVADNLPLDALSSAELEQFADRAKELGIEIEAGTAGVRPEHLGRYIRIAQRVGARVLRVLTDTADEHPSAKEIAADIKAVVPQLKDAGVTLGIENHDRFPSGTLAGIVESIGSETVGTCLDTTNSFAVMERPEVVVETLGPYAVDLHLKDFVIFRAPQMMGFMIEGRPVGTGRLEVEWVLGRLRDFGRDPNAILELWTPQGETLSATIEKEALWVAESVEYVRRFIAE